MEEKIDMNTLNLNGTKIGFTFNNKTPWFMHAEQNIIYIIIICF